MMVPVPPASSVRLMVALALAGGLVACDPGGMSRVPLTTASPGQGQAVRPATVTVRAGDTVYAIARRFNLSVRDLIEANRLEAPYQLSPGMVLRLPGGADDYVVQKGDTLLGLARRFKIDFNTLAATNNKTPPYLLRIGEHLTIPGPRLADQGTAVASLSRPSGSPAPSSSPPPSSSPASSPVAPTSQAGGGAPPAGRGGAIVITSPRAGGRDGASDPASSPPSAAGAAPAPSASEAGEPAAPVAPPPVAARPPVDPPPPPPKSGSGFLWPVKGEVVAEFGPLPGKGQHNDGINIAVPRGTLVRAAENGVVVYVGNELKGFGNLLLIKHADGWMTAYAHAEQMKVQRGDKVKRGQPIATVGSSGNAAQPQLHFEIRRGTEAVNPLEHLQDRVSMVEARKRFSLTLNRSRKISVA